MHYGIDDNFKNSGIKAQGLLIGDYEFREDSTQNHSGVFNGLITLYWYVDKFDDLLFDDLERILEVVTILMVCQGLKFQIVPLRLILK